MSATAERTVRDVSLRRSDRRKYLTWEQRSKTASPSPRRRRSCSLPDREEAAEAAPAAASSGPQIAVVVDMATSTRVGRLLRRRLTDIWRRRSRRRRQRSLRPSCNADESPPAGDGSSSVLLRRTRSVAVSTRRGTRAPSASLTRSTWPWRTTRPTTLTTDTAAVHAAASSGTGNTAAAASPAASLRIQIVSFFQVSDNKLAMKLFGNKNALEKEKIRHKAVGHWVIHPCSDFRSSVCCCRSVRI